MLRRIGISVLLCLGCLATASVVVKAPVEHRCNSVGLGTYPEVVDGVVACLNGDKKLAEEKASRWCCHEYPGTVLPFAEVEKDVSSVPGASQYAKPINEVALLLLGELPPSPPVPLIPPPPLQSGGSAAVNEAPDTPPKKAIATVLALQALSAGPDPNRVRTETVSLTEPGNVNTCDIAGTVGQCSPRRPGPLFVTDVIAQAGCPGRLFVGGVIPNKGQHGPVVVH